ncbi:MAG: hypothetical protein U0798_20475 [Gemmataceae bacterium]
MPPPVERDLLLPWINASLMKLIGEKYLFPRMSYGGELTLHFGELCKPKSLKLKDLSNGTFILGVRGSTRLLKPGNDQRLVLTQGISESEIRETLGQPVTVEDLESGRFIKPQSVVVSVFAFYVPPFDGIGFNLKLSDMSDVVILPMSPSKDDEDISDWELFTPDGMYLAVGPGPKVFNQKADEKISNSIN